MVNLEKLKFHFDGDSELISELLEIFKRSYKDHLNSLKLAIAQKNFQEIELHAHTLKGMVSNFFADEVKQNIFNIEKLGRNQSIVGIDQEVESFRSKVLQMIEEVENAKI